MIRPTTIEDPTTKVPNDSITRPATSMADSGEVESALRINLVEATLRTSLINVTPRRIAGKALKSNARRM